MLSVHSDGRVLIALALFLLLSSPQPVFSQTGAGGTPPDSRADAALEKRAVAAGFVSSVGKEAVKKRLEALFRSSSKPMMSTKRFVPDKPYLVVTDVENEDKTAPKRSIIVYRFRFVDAAKAQDAVEAALSDAGVCETSPTQNTIVINVLRDKVPTIKATLLAMDVPLPQVLVETQIIEVTIKQGEERDVKFQYTNKDAKTGTTSTYGYALNSPTQSRDNTESSGFDFFPIATGSKDGNSSTLQAALRWLNTSSDAKILAAPNVIADLGTEATMSTGEDLPYMENSVTNSAVTQSTLFKRTGITLKITPTLINNDVVQLEINPQITIAVRYEKFSSTSGSGENANLVVNNVPVVSVRNITTRLTAADGEIIMLGGLYSSETSEELRKMPFLSDIPLLGELFTAKDATTSEKQLIFFMKVHIIPNPYSVSLDPEATVKDLKGLADTIHDSDILFDGSPYPRVTESMTQRGFWSQFFSDEEMPDGSTKKKRIMGDPHYTTHSDENKSAADEGAKK